MLSVVHLILLKIGCTVCLFGGLVEVNFLFSVGVSKTIQQRLTVHNIFWNL